MAFSEDVGNTAGQVAGEQMRAFLEEREGRAGEPPIALSQPEEGIARRIVIGDEDKRSQSIADVIKEDLAGMTEAERLADQKMAELQRQEQRAAADATFVQAQQNLEASTGYEVTIVANNFVLNIPNDADRASVIQQLNKDAGAEIFTGVRSLEGEIQVQADAITPEVLTNIRNANNPDRVMPEQSAPQVGEPGDKLHTASHTGELQSTAPTPVGVVDGAALHSPVPAGTDIAAAPLSAPQGQQQPTIPAPRPERTEILTDAESIKQAQQDLKDLGYDIDPDKKFKNEGVDGINGKVTSAELKKFQEENGLEATGKVTKETLQKLEEKQAEMKKDQQQGVAEPTPVQVAQPTTVELPDGEPMPIPNQLQPLPHREHAEPPRIHPSIGDPKPINPHAKEPKKPFVPGQGTREYPAPRIDEGGPMRGDAAPPPGLAGMDLAALGAAVAVAKGMDNPYSKNALVDVDRDQPVIAKAGGGAKLPVESAFLA